MKKIKQVIKQIDDWSSAHIGMLTLLLLICYVLPNPFAKIDVHSLDNFFSYILKGLIYKPGLTIYQLIIGSLAILLYVMRLKRKYTIHIITQRFLVGDWRNDWGPPSQGWEYLTIDTNLKYYILNGTHVFNIDDFKYNIEKNQIQFYKTAVREGDNRKYLNILTIENNDLLVGIEQDYPIKYTRVRQVHTIIREEPNVITGINAITK